MVMAGQRRNMLDVHRRLNLQAWALALLLLADRPFLPCLILADTKYFYIHRLSKSKMSDRTDDDCAIMLSFPNPRGGQF